MAGSVTWNMKAESSKTRSGESGVQRTPARPAEPAALAFDLVEGDYRVRLAGDAQDLERALRLRFEVFNRELGEGLEEAWETGIDEDRFDRTCHHLLLEDRATGELVGTYRMQTVEMAVGGEGLYCAQEFDFSTVPPDVLTRSVELGRACITRGHRNGTALFALWRGLAAYLDRSGKRYFFGCCSLTSQDPKEGVAVLRRLEHEGRMWPGFTVHPRPSHACRVPEGSELPEVPLPRLFKTYLRYGALACGPPAIDREFGTIDFLVLFDSKRLPRRLFALFFTGLGLGGGST